MYLNKQVVEEKIDKEKTNNPNNADTENLEKSLATAEASMENALFFCIINILLLVTN